MLLSYSTVPSRASTEHEGKEVAPVPKNWGRVGTSLDEGDLPGVQVVGGSLAEPPPRLESIGSMIMRPVTTMKLSAKR